MNLGHRVVKCVQKSHDALHDDFMMILCFRVMLDMLIYLCSPKGVGMLVCECS
jgi:hypothetical protein